MSNVLKLVVPSHLFLKANGTQPHWAKRKDMVKALRMMAAKQCKEQRVKARTGKSLVLAVIGYPTAHKADPANAAPTVKPIIDGMTDAGVFPDDNSDYVVQGFDRDKEKSERGSHSVTIRLIDFPEVTGLMKEHWEYPATVWCAGCAEPMGITWSSSAVGHDLYHGSCFEQLQEGKTE